MLGNMKDRMKNVTDKAKGSAGSLKEGANGMFNKAIASSMSEIQSLTPILKKSGFIIGDIIIGIAINPKVNLVIEQIEEGELSIKDALKQEDLTKFQITILNSIDKIHNLNSVVGEYNHTIGQIEIELGIPPTVRVHLNSVKSRAFSTNDKKSAQPLGIEIE